MRLKIIISLLLISSVYAGSNLPNSKFNFSLIEGVQEDTTLSEILLQGRKVNSLKSDLIRSAAGTALGAIVGAGITGYLPAILNRDYESPSFPDNSYYLRSYMGASFLAALSSATVLYFSKNREISYWKISTYSIIPPMILVLPLSVYASVNERDELVRSTWIATLTSIGISAVWSVLVYRIHPLKNDNLVSISFAKPYLRYTNKKYGIRKPDITIGIKVIELQF
jgi:hypothetical protein